MWLVVKIVETNIKFICLMKLFLLFILRFLGCFIIFISGFYWFIYSLDNKSWLAIPAFLFWILGTGFYMKLVSKKKCPNCGKLAVLTGNGGTKYKEWICEKCNKTFWTTLLLHEYEE